MSIHIATRSVVVKGIFFLRKSSRLAKGPFKQVKIINGNVMFLLKIRVFSLFFNTYSLGEKCSCTTMVNGIFSLKGPVNEKPE
jgi:hypothetical protein